MVVSAKLTSCQPQGRSGLKLKTKSTDLKLLSSLRAMLIGLKFESGIEEKSLMTLA